MGVTIDQIQAENVLSVLKRRAVRLQVEEVVAFCSDLTRDQVLRTIDYLARREQVYLTLDFEGKYWVKV